MVTYAAEETREPERTIPRALMIGTAVVVVTYLALNSAYLLVLPFDRVLASTHIAFDATRATAGPAAASAISVLVIVSSFGAMSGIILAGPRVYYAAGVGAQTMKRCIAIAGVVVVTSVVSGLRASEQITLNAETAKTAEKKSQDFSACSPSSALKRRCFHTLFCRTVTVAQTPRAEMTRVPQFDNERATSWKSVIPPHTESTLHRHDRFRTIIGIVGGDLTTVDSNGRKTVTHYETGKSYWQEPMPPGAMHKDVNDTNKAIELIVVENK